MEIWRAGGTCFGTSAKEAQTVEAEGWDGQMFMDSQCLSADPYALMGVWAGATSRLQLSTGVTNPLTRNLAVTAGSAATIHALSHGRAVLGIGRGDSALAYLGHAPSPLSEFRLCLEQLQTLLAGQEIPFEQFTSTLEARSIDHMSLGAKPSGVRLQWLPLELSKVPLDVAATGPKVISLAAQIAERLTFSVGADPMRIQWALNIARNASLSANTSPSYGAQVVVVCHPDPQIAMDVAMHMAPPLARFQTMQGPVGPVDEGGKADLHTLQQGYDMREHGHIQSKDRIGGAALSPEFIKRFAVVGAPDHCFQRLSELHALGLERLVIVGPGFYPPEWGAAANLFAQEVLPALTALSTIKP